MKTSRLPITEYSRASGQDVFVPQEITSAFSRPDYPFRGIKSYNVIFRTDLKALKGILPPDLRPIPEYQDLVILQINTLDCPDKLLRPYRETVVAVPAILKTKSGEDIAGSYISQLYLGSTSPESNVTPILTAQMIYGFPKREAIYVVNGEFGEGNLKISAERHGSTIFDIKLTVKKGEIYTPPANMPPLIPQFILKAVPDAAGKGWDVLEITLSTPGDCIPFQINEMCPAEALFNGDITLDSGRVIPVNEIIAAYFGNYDWCVSWGTTVKDYLNGL